MAILSHGIAAMGFIICARSRASFPGHEPAPRQPVVVDQPRRMGSPHSLSSLAQSTKLQWPFSEPINRNRELPLVRTNRKFLGAERACSSTLSVPFLYIEW